MGFLRFNEDSYAHFVTTKTYRGRRVFDNAMSCRILVEELQYAQEQLHFNVLAYCIMPDHFHLIVQWDADVQLRLTISRLMRDVKGHSARRILDFFQGRRGPLTSSSRSLGQGIQATHGGEYPHRRMSKQTHRIWQPSFYDFNIYSEQKLRQKIEYIC